MVDHDVARLEIAVDHAAAMGAGDAVGDLPQQRRDLARGAPAAADELVEAEAVDQFHREPRFALARHATLVQRDDRRMPQARDDLDLAFEADPLALAREAAAEQHLDRAGATRRELLGAVDRALRAAVDLVAEPVAGDRGNGVAGGVDRVGRGSRRIRAIEDGPPTRRRRKCLCEFTEERVVGRDALDDRAADRTSLEVCVEALRHRRARVDACDRRQLEVVAGERAATRGGGTGLRGLARHQPRSPSEGRAPDDSQSPGASSYSASRRRTISRSLAATRLLAR